MMTAAPVDLSLAGRYVVMEGRWMPDTMCSPFSFGRTTSSGILPAAFLLSEPGAPFGQRRITWGSAAPAPAQNANQHIARQTPFRTRFVACKVGLLISSQCEPALTLKS